VKVKIRADSVEIEGYVNAVGRDSRKLVDEYGYPFIEQIQPGTFGRALTSAAEKDQEILMLLDHDNNHVIGGTNSNLELEEDSIGLHARAVVTDAETIRAAQEKRLSGWSFGFRMLDFDPTYERGCDKRVVTELDLVEVSVIDDRMTPAYAGTSIHARADASDETIYTRTIMDDEVAYEEETAAADDTGAAPETVQADEAPSGDAPEVRADTPDPDTVKPDFSMYRNRIRLLKLSC